MIFAALSAVSCLQEEVSQTQDQGMYFSFMASRENMKNKTIIVDNNKVEWVKGDRIVVFNGKGVDAGAVADDGQQFFDEKWERGWQFNGQTSGKIVCSYRIPKVLMTLRRITFLCIRMIILIMAISN